MTRSGSALMLAAALAAVPLFAQDDHAHHEGGVTSLGSVSFPNSGAAPAQAPFLRGIALLHSFEYTGRWAGTES